MKHIIIRKPKFMRNDAAVAPYMALADTIGMQLTRPDTSLEEVDSLLMRICECVNKAARAGGFFRTKDFIEWMDRQKHTV